MSSSTGYYVSPIDLAAERRRALRTEIAALRSRLDKVNRRARAAGVAATSTPATRASENETALTADAAALRQAVEDTEQRVKSRWQERWRTEVTAKRGATAGKATRAATSELRESRQRSRATATAAEEAVDAERRRRVLDGMVETLARESPRCDPADVAVLTERFAAMSELTDLSDLRAAELDLSVAVSDAVAGQKARDADDDRRARLMALVEEALPEDRHRLRAGIESAADCRVWENEVHEAVGRADSRRHRDFVANAVTQALVDAGCEPEDDFTALLLSEGQAVVGLGEDIEDYGLLVRLPEDGRRLLASVVRPEDLPADPNFDVPAQQRFCDRTLPTITAALGDNGVSIDPRPFHLTQPGRAPVAPVPSYRVRRRTRSGKSRRSTQVLRERGR